MRTTYETKAKAARAASRAEAKGILSRIALLKHPEVKAAWMLIPSALRAQSFLSLGLYSKRVRITTTLRNLDSFKDKKLTVLLERFMGDDWATRSDDYAEDEPNRDYECIKKLGDNFEVKISISAYVKSDSPLCRVVVTGVTERIVREETREIVCA